MPGTSRLAEDLSIPVAAIIRPFADLDDGEEPIPLVECGDSGPARCEKCGGYVNSWCTWVAGGTKWKCNLCSHETRGKSSAQNRIATLGSPQRMIVEPHYFSALDANFARLDYSERPELQKGTVDFDVSQSTDYWASNPQDPDLSATDSNPTPDTAVRSPQNMQYMFVLDVSDTSVRSGFLATTCVALRAILYGRFSEDGSEEVRACLPSGCSIAFLTFDDALHFYDLSVCTLSSFRQCFETDRSLQPEQASHKELVVPDVDDPFLPLPPSALFVDPYQSRCEKSFQLIREMLNAPSP
jgi:protein transport protein SEC24